MAKWKCSVCGYETSSDDAPDQCPVCGAEKTKFNTIETPEPTPSYASSFQLSARIDFITRLHGHPIAVHIPNGVLPLSFLFTLIAVAFKSEAFATAAAYNIAFVCLSMPIVVITGFIDWYNRFNARWAKIFSIKFTCGIVVGTISLIIALMWFIQPTIYQELSARLILFLALNIINLIAAAVAGYYGGKLVFNKSI
jgi:uncharacterized membrane protein/rubredoxin